MQCYEGVNVMMVVVVNNDTNDKSMYDRAAESENKGVRKEKHKTKKRG